MWATHSTCVGEGITRASHREAATVRRWRKQAAASTPPLRFNASDDGVRPNKRSGRSIGGRREIRSRVRNSQSLVRRRPQRELAERKTLAVAVVAARNCNEARERCRAQSYPCRRSSAEQFQTPNANTANAITKYFFPIIEEFLLLFRRFNPKSTAKLPRKIRNSARANFS